ncbi:hypothetical protein O5O45_29485 [Hahella aquimaris]|uniref:hypothetical protein n=1 Tax=Hahella sp. HNIBRBA332 TaxID=3015983 RepID=UPI00273B2A3B|nr:hypothetical protein [Hahella sp. HNIBRBA332]WLQ13859.1 hypothetical protein O5O45_29485 [Hahella sp. HNIBRBA332]
MAGRWLSQFLRVEIWLIGALIAVLTGVFLRSVDDLVDNAGEVGAQQMKAAFLTSLRLAHTAWLAKGGRSDSVELGALAVGSDFSPDDFQEQGGGILRMNAQGWPVDIGDSNPAPPAAMTDESCLRLYSALLLRRAGGSQMALQEKVEALAVGTVCAYQVGVQGKDFFSLLYNAESGEVRLSIQRKSADND